MVSISIKEYKNEPYVRITSLAVVAMLLFSYLLFDQTIDLLSIIFMLLIITLTAYFLKYPFKKVSLTNSFIVGFLAYTAFFIVMMFFQITNQEIMLSDELITGIIFGGISALSYYALKNL